MATIRPTECNILIGSQRSIGFGPECSPCEESTNITWLKEIESFDEGRFRDTEAKRSSLGRRDNKTTLKVTDSGTTWSFTMQITRDSLGIFLGGIFNDLTTDAGAIPEFTHDFTVDPEFCPPTYTIAIVTPCYHRRILGSILSSVSISANVGEDPTVTISGEGAFPEDVVLGTYMPLFLDEETYELKDFCIFQADTIDDIDADLLSNDGTELNPYETKLCIESFQLDITNEVKSRVCLGDFDACENKKRYWGNFDTTGSFTKCFDCADPFNEDYLDQNVKALKFCLIDQDNLLAGGSNATFCVDLFSYRINNISDDFPEDDVVLQTVDFEYVLDDVTDSSVAATLINEQDGSMYLPDCP